MQPSCSDQVTKGDLCPPPPTLPPAGNYSKLESLLIVLWECSCPLLNEFYWKKPVMEYPQCKINLLPGSGLIILRALAAGGGSLGGCRGWGSSRPVGSSCYRSGSAARILGCVCYRLRCRLGCGGAVPGGELLVPGDPAASCPTPRLLSPGPAGPLSGPTWDMQVGVPFLQGSPLLQAPWNPRPSALPVPPPAPASGGAISGLTADSLLPSCLCHPALFCLAPSPALWSRPQGAPSQRGE